MMAVARFDESKVEAVRGEIPEGREELGMLEWHTIWDRPVTRAMLEKAFKGSGLDEGFLPPPIQPQDIFRRKTSIRRKRLPREESAETFENYSVTEVSSNKDRIVRVLVKDVVDSGNVRLSHEDVGEFSYDRYKGTVFFMKYGEIDKSVLAVIDDVTENFMYYCDFYNGRTIRDLVRDVLSTTNTLPLKGHGGVYFVPRGHKELLMQLQAMVNYLEEDNDNPGKRSSIKAVTLMNKTQERVIIKETFEDHVRERMKEINEFVDNTTSVLQQKGVVSRKEVEHRLASAKGLTQVVMSYEGLLEEELTGLRAGVDIMRQQLAELFNRIEE